MWHIVILQFFYLSTTEVMFQRRPTVRCIYIYIYRPDLLIHRCYGGDGVGFALLSIECHVNYFFISKKL